MLLNYFDFVLSLCQSVFSVYENKVLQLMSAGASLERFGEKDLVFLKVKIVQTLHRGAFSNFLSGEFTAMTVINPGD